MDDSESKSRYDRRAFMKLAAVSAAATAAGCSSEPANKLIPYLVPPESLVPGVPLWYKSTCRECPAGCGIVVKTREGRAIKVEGNPDHPINRGGLCIRGQAALQGLYDPDRVRQPLRRDEHGRLIPATWDEAEALLANLISYLRYQKQSRQIVFWSHRVTGSLESLFGAFVSALGSEHFQMYEPFACEQLRAANRMVFGTPEIPVLDISSAKVLISFGSDFLETWISNAGYARDFAAFRGLRRGTPGKFIHIEPRQSMTAAAADEWIASGPGTEGHLVMGLIREILRSGLAVALPEPEVARIRSLVADYDPERVSRWTGVRADRIVSLARLFAAADPGLAIGGGVAVLGTNATATLAAVNLLNYVCGNIGRTVRFGGGTDLEHLATMKDVSATVELMRRGEIPLMFFYHTDPAHNLPGGSAFEEALHKVAFKVSFSSYMDETAVLCDLILPDTTPLECWEDYSPRRGVHGIAQPVMEPLLQVKSTPDFLLSVAKRLGEDLAHRFPQRTFREYMVGHWRDLHKEFEAQQEFDRWFRAVVEDGGIWRHEEAPARQVHLGSASFALEPPRHAEGFHLIAYPSLHLYDGRSANRPWLQETPDPVTRLVWDSWLEIHPEAAGKLAIQEGDLIKVTSPHGQLQVAAHITNSIRPDAVAIPIGQGHREYGRYAKERGVNVLELLSPESEPASGGRRWGAIRVDLERLPIKRPLVTTQASPTQAGRELVQIIASADSRKSLLSGNETVGREEDFSLYPSHEHPQYRWGMAIDLNACIGCNACVAACYAENNVAVVGREQVRRGRHMAWIRIDRFEDADHGSLRVRYLPLLCQHCDNGPCESVCPVYATYHNNEGLNAQIYNRCVGTRYCSNNCPYHVRRFNWYDYEWPYPMTLQLNPDITVRSKGVMEKCTFCVQRIRAAKDAAKDEGRRIRDGEIVPACAQTCPTEAIVFGDLKDPDSKVSRLARDARGYHLLGHLNTRPAITYLKKIENNV